MYAVIETGQKQYRVEVGTELQVELIDGEPGQTITLERVLLVADGDTAAIGRPVVEGATVSAEVVRRDRGEKVIAFKYRPKARRRVKKGHRQDHTVLRIADIVFEGKSAAEAVRKAEAAAKTERQRLEEAAARQAAEDSALAAKLARAAEKEAKDRAGQEAKDRAGATGRGAKGRPGGTAGRKAENEKGRRAGTKADASAGEAPKAARGSARSTDGEPKRASSTEDGPEAAPKRPSRTKKDD